MLRFFTLHTWGAFYIGRKIIYNYCMNYTNAYEPPTLTVDLVLFTIQDAALKTLIIKRPAEPFKGEWALVGGYCPKGETTHDALHRVALQKAGIDIEKDLGYVRQLQAFDTVARDPRGHAVSVTYIGVGRTITPRGGSAEVQFSAIDSLPAVAYDHQDIIDTGREHLRVHSLEPQVLASLLPKEFTLAQLQEVHEVLVGEAVDKRNFRKRVLSMNMVQDTGELYRDGAHRPAKLYRFV